MRRHKGFRGTKASLLQVPCALGYAARDLSFILDYEFEGIVVATVLDDAVVRFGAQVADRLLIMANRVGFFGVTVGRREEKTFRLTLWSFRAAAHCWYHRQIHWHATVKEGAIKLFQAFWRR